MKRRSRYSKLVAFALALVAGGVSPVLAQVQSPVDPERTWRDKVHPLVLEQVQDGPAEFILFLDDQVRPDLEAAALDKPARTRAVVEQLRSHAERSQAALIARLEQLGAEYRSYWIANMVWVRADAVRMVKEGVAWWALLFPALWLLYHRLWLALIGYLALVTVVELALAIAQKVIYREISIAQETVVHVAKEALVKVDDPGRIIIKMNPSDLQFINETKYPLSKLTVDVNHIALEAEESIQSGGCIIETELGEIDARIEKQLQAIEESFRSAMVQAN